MADDDGAQGDGGEASADTRLDALEAGQAAQTKELGEQRGLLERILGRLPGGEGAGTDGGNPGSSGDAAAGALTLEQIQAGMRAEMAAADQRRATEEGAAAERAWREGVDAALEELKPEHQPREQVGRIRGAVQRAMYGGGDRG